MKTVYTNETIPKESLDLLYRHLENDDLYHTTLDLYDRYDNHSEIFETGFISMFYFPHLNYDILLSAAENDTFSKGIWRAITTQIKKYNETKRTLVIPSIEGKDILVKHAAKYGGKYIQGDIWFN